MKKINFNQFALIAIVLLTMYTIQGCKQNTTDFVKETYKEKQNQIAQTITEIFNAGKAKDLKKLEAFHLNSPKFTKFESGSPSRLNFEENTKGEAGAFSAAEEFNYKINDLKVDVFENVGIATFTFPYDAKMQGIRFSDTLHCTLVFVEAENKWKITHEHFSKAN